MGVREIACYDIHAYQICILHDSRIFRPHFFPMGKVGKNQYPLLMTLTRLRLKGLGIRSSVAEP